MIELYELNVLNAECAHVKINSQCYTAVILKYTIPFPDSLLASPLIADLGDEKGFTDEFLSV
jgi:hypothetical protein